LRQKRIERRRRAGEGRAAIKADKETRQPKRLSPAGLKQVGVTDTVRDYVSRFKVKSKIVLARQIVADVASFENVDLPLNQARARWAKRSATTVIRTRQAVRMDQEQAARLEKPAIMGCTDKSFAIVAALRAAKFNVWIVRTATHTYCKFIYRNQVWVADASSTTRPKVRPMTDVDKRLEWDRRKRGLIAEGPSFAQIGINRYSNFQKYYKG